MGCVYRTAWLVSFLLNNPVIDSNPESASNVYCKLMICAEVLLYCPIHQRGHIRLFEVLLLELVHRYLVPASREGSPIRIPSEKGALQSYVFLLQIVVDWVDEWVIIPASSPKSIVITMLSVHLYPSKSNDPKKSVVAGKLPLANYTKRNVPFHSKLSCNRRNSSNLSSSPPTLPSCRWSGKVSWATSASICLNPRLKANGS